MWTPLTYTADFVGGDGATGTMASQSFVYNVAQGLTPNGFTRTGYSFNGWRSGSKDYANGASATLTANAVFTARWTANTYTAVFDGNGSTGGSTASQSLTYGASETLRGSGFTRSGYTFAGWAKTRNGAALTTTAIHNLTAINGGTVTLYAVWTDGAYKITFNGNGSTGGTMDKEDMSYNVSSALTANAFTRTGYDFAGWGLTEAAAVPVYTDGQSVTEIVSVGGGTNFSGSVTLYAVWNPATYVVAFDGNGSTGGTMNSEKFFHDVAKALPVNGFTRTGYTFRGWAAASDATDAQYLNGATARFTQDVRTLYAVWTENSYAVAFDANGGAGGMADESFTYTGRKTLSANSFTRTGYAFAGWNTQADGKGASYTAGAEVSKLTAVNGAELTLYAQWTANTYTVTLRGSFAGAGENTVDSFTYDADPKALTGCSFTRAGYTFTGWNTQADGKGTSYADRQQIYNLTAKKGENLDLYAIWAPDVTALRFDANGGSGSMAEQIIVTGAEGNLSPNAFVRTGYTFAGWNTQAGGGGTNYGDRADVTTLNNVAVLYARWTPVIYTIAYDANGATSGSAPADQTLTYGTGLKLAAGAALSKTGSSFTGWSESSAATAATYAPGASISAVNALPGGTVTLYAVWQATSFSIAYSVNGGQGGMTSGSVTLGSSVTLAENTFTRDGYTFTGWNTRADGSGTSYGDMASLTPSPDAFGAFTLYAQWARSDLASLSGTIEKGSTAVAGATVLVKQGTVEITRVTADSNGGYRINNLEPGEYDVIVIAGTKSTTHHIAVTGSGAMALDVDVTYTSQLSLEPGASPDTPSVMVNGLDELARIMGENLSLRIVGEVEDSGDAEQNELRQLSGLSNGVYFDISLSGDSGALTDVSPSVLELSRPFTFSDKSSVKLLRYHNGAAEEFAELYERPASARYADGTYYADRKTGILYLYTSKFSTYVIGYSTFTSAVGTIEIKQPDGDANGTLSATPARPFAGQTVTLTPAPKKGYRVAEITVADKYGKAVAVTKNADGTYSFTMPVGSVTVTPRFVPESPFTDTAEGEYYYEAVLWAVEKGITQGTGAATFSPNGVCTRAQAVTFLWRASGSPAPTSAVNPFSDVSRDAYYYDAVLWAVEKGITRGTGTTAFSPEDTCSRAQIVTLQYRAAGSPATGAVIPFTDVAGDAYYYDAVLWAVEKGITQGAGATAFSPDADCARAQIVTFLFRQLGK